MAIFPHQIKIGAILRLNIEVRGWRCDELPRDEGGPFFNYPVGTIFEVVEIYIDWDFNRERMRAWLPRYEHYQSRIPITNSIFDLISKP